MGTNRDLSNQEGLLGIIKAACDKLGDEGLESLVITVENNSHCFLGSPCGINYLKDNLQLIADFIQYCKDKKSSDGTEERCGTAPLDTHGAADASKDRGNLKIGFSETEPSQLQGGKDDLDQVDEDTEDTDEYEQDVDVDMFDNMCKFVGSENTHGYEDEKESSKENRSDVERNKNDIGDMQQYTMKHRPRTRKKLSVNKADKNGEMHDQNENSSYECSYCEAVFKTELELADHVGKKHEKLPKEGTFPCSRCGFMFSYKAHVIEHNQRNPDCILDVGKNTTEANFSQTLQQMITFKDAESKKLKKLMLKDILDVSCAKLPVKCPFCKKLFDTVFTYQCHILVHSNIRLRRCHICLKQFQSQSGLPRHLTVHEDRPYFCSTCHGRFQNQARRDHHVTYSCKMTKHRPGLICPDCGYQTKSKSHLMLHQRKHTRVQSTCKCDLCGKFFKSTVSLNSHIQNSHEGPFQCEICGKTYKNRDTLKRHEKEHAGLKFKCEFCDKRWSEVSKLNRHLKTHSGVKEFPFICEMCGKAFSRKTILDNHRLLHTGEKPFKCDLEGCSKAFRNITALKQHKEYHISYFPFMCDFCGRAFKRECLLKHHRKSHTEWQWPCDYCKEKFNSRKRFKSHIISHHQDRIPEVEKKTKMAFFKCTVCFKILSEKTVFQEHMSIHKGHKPNKCGFCGKGFSARSNMRQHEKNHVEGKKLKCNYCSRTYSEPKTLAFHVNSKHPNKSDPRNETEDQKAVIELEVQPAASSSFCVSSQHPDKSDTNTDTEHLGSVVQS